MYTDGSAQSAIKNGGSGAYIEYPDGRTDTVCLPAGKYSNNFNTEVKAITAAAEKFRNPSLDSSPLVFLTDARSVLEALNHRKLQELRDSLSDIGKHRRVALQWVPSHCGIPGNEKADRLAKNGSLMQQPDCTVTFQQKKNMIINCRRPTTPTHADYHLLDRAE